MKLISKLIRMEESTIKEIEQLETQLNESQYISFSALVRKLIKIGLDNFKENKMNENAYSCQIDFYKGLIIEIRDLKEKIERRRLGDTSDHGLTSSSYSEALKSLKERMGRSAQDITDGELKDLDDKLSYFKKTLIDAGFDEIFIKKITEQAYEEDK